MAHTYYTRLTLVHPKDVNKLDPRLGIVIAETATTGRFIVTDVSWQSVINANAITSIAMNHRGELRIHEPTGMAMLDYIKAAAFQVGTMNYLDCRYLLEVEVFGENVPESGTPYKYIWPIMFISTDVKATVTEKGTEYNVTFVHTGHHGQTDLVQPIKETTKIEAGTVGEYFKKLQIELETKEFKYAAARQKAGGGAAGGGDNPAAADVFHDEYHFLIEPRIEKYGFTTKGKADPAIQGTWGNTLFGTGRFNISVRPGTPLTQQITKILQSTKDISDLLPGRPKPASSDASGSSEQSKANLESMLGSVYQFFRVETYSVYKSYDYIRQRYATKHVFLIYLADQPNMYQYPDEIALLNKLSNKDKVYNKLRYYLQEGLLRKLYYFNYTGMNTEVIRTDLQYNQAYSLPSFPVIWADRGQAGSGAMNIENYNRRVSPYVHGDDAGSARIDIEQMQRKAQELTMKLKADMQKYAKGDPEAYQRYVTRKGKQAQKDYKDLQDYITFLNSEIAKRESEFNTQQQAVTGSTIKNRKDLFDTLVYAEDVGQNGNVWETIYKKAIELDYPNLIPRMEPDVIGEQVDIVKSENEKLMEKIFAVQLAPRDLVNLDMEIIGDPYWLGVPNLLLNGKIGLDKIELPSSSEKEIRAMINSRMPNIEKGWDSKEPVWSDYGVAQWYKGGQLFYFCTMMPDGGAGEDDLLTFNYNDQIVGIYKVVEVENIFKEGKWTQKLKTIRDVTIPSHILPRANLTKGGDVSFEDWADGVLASEDRARDRINDLRQQGAEQRDAELKQEALSGDQGMGAGGVTAPTTVASTPGVSDALNKQRAILRDNPPPAVADPVTNAQAMVDSGKSRNEAYEAAKRQYSEETKAYYQHLEEADKKAYAEAGVPNHKPYSSETLAGLAMTKSGAGGLDDWKSNNTARPGPAEVNNPLGVGYIAERNKYNGYNTWEEGLKAGNEYYNYGVGVIPSGRNGPNRYLLPSDVKGSEAEYIRKASLGGKG
jgi:antitoxin component of MazEF toxin-antitoxin module